MNRSLIGIACSLCIMVAGPQISAQAAQRIDLRKWGYTSPEDASSLFQRQLSAQLVSVSKNAETSVGFVTRDRTGLATREFPPLTFHVVRFAKSGKFLSQLTIPTPSWNENAIFYGSDDSLLIRTGTKLSLFSSDMERVAERDLPVTRDSVLINWKIYPLPNRTAFLLYNYRKSETSIALLRWDDLKPIKQCPYSPYDRVLAVSNDDVLSFHPSRAEAPLRREVEVSEICGPTRFSYSWEGDATDAAVIDDDSMILAGGSSTVRFVVRDKVRWTTAFDKKSDVVSDNIQISEDGQLAAIAVKKFTGGSQFFDIPRKVKAVRVIVYDVNSGRSVSDVPLQPAPLSAFDFALSPTGNALAILSDGFLEIIPVKGPS